ncbi:MAG: HlyD family efflux transporter periplasmic adaptor subunit [Bacteroidetes bacterium]|nr:HlyD family efflux transporter periplasmic adaptor subunit [Bacteroidota bacterium]
MKHLISFTIAALLLSACNNGNNQFDASGAFEAQEIIISAETAGTLKQFDAEEGENLTAGQFIGYTDSTQLYLKKKQLEAQINALLSRRPDIAAQIGALQEQLKSAQKEQSRIANLLKSEAATQKMMDDVTAQIEVLKKQIDALQSSLSITSGSITQESVPLQITIQQVNDQLAKSRIINQVNGTVLAKYAEPNEVVAPGKPLYKIADLSFLILRAYITGNQLPETGLNKKVKVFTDNSAGSYNEHEGTITWISDKAEFTPKTIQTKDERANLVYAVKIRVKNDGSLKIGMYGEVRFLHGNN